MKKYIIIHFVVLTFSLIYTVSSGDITATNKNVEEALINDTVVMKWQVTPGQNQKIISLLLYVLPDDIEVIQDIKSPGVTSQGKLLFQDRLTATFNTAGKNEYIVTLERIQYKDNRTYQLRVIFDDGTNIERKIAAIHIKNVGGAPEMCGKSLNSEYTIIETAKITLTQDICGHPKPFVEWKLEEDNTFVASSSSMLINNISLKYRYSFTTREMVRSHCGERIFYTAKNKVGSIKGNSTIHITFKPSKITLTSSYRYNASCVYLTWYREDTGNCLMEYHLKFDDKDDVYKTFSTNFTLCHSRCTSTLYIWASYKGDTGGKIDIALHKIKPRPDTTIMPSFTTTSKGNTALNTDPCQCASKITIAIVTTVVIGLILIIVIFLTMKHKGFLQFNKNPKKASQNTERRDDDNYEVAEITSSHYADLNVKSVKPSIYADLTKTSDSSKEYAEIELNETKRNMYANMNS